MNRAHAAPLLATTALMALAVLGCAPASRPTAAPSAMATALPTTTATTATATATATLTPEQPLTDAQRRTEIDVLRRRISTLVPAGTVDGAGPGFTIGVPAADTASITELTGPGRLTFREVFQQGASSSRGTAVHSSVPPVAAPPAGALAAYSALRCSTAPATAAAGGWLAACDPLGHVKYLLGPAAVGNADVAGAVAAPDTADSESWRVEVDFTARGQTAFTTLTERTVGRQLAIVLDGTVRFAPTINEPVAGAALISGGLSRHTATSLAATIAGGELPAPLRVTATSTSR